EGDAGDLLPALRIGEEAPGAAEAMLDDVLGEGLSGLLKEAVDIARRHRDRSGDALDAEVRLARMVGDRSEDGAKPARLHAALGDGLVGGPEHRRDEVR